MPAKKNGKKKKQTTNRPPALWNLLYKSHLTDAPRQPRGRGGGKEGVGVERHARVITHTSAVTRFHLFICLFVSPPRRLPRPLLPRLRHPKKPTRRENRERDEEGDHKRGWEGGGGVCECARKRKKITCVVASAAEGRRRQQPSGRDAAAKSLGAKGDADQRLMHG